MKEVIFILCIAVIFAWITVTQVVINKRKKKFVSERKRYIANMRKLGFKDWEIQNYLNKIKSYTALKNLADELEKACEKWKL